MGSLKTMRQCPHLKVKLPDTLSAYSKSSPRFWRKAFLSCWLVEGCPIVIWRRLYVALSSLLHLSCSILSWLKS